MCIKNLLYFFKISSRKQYNNPNEPRQIFSTHFQHTINNNTHKPDELDASFTHIQAPRFASSNRIVDTFVSLTLRRRDGSIAMAAVLVGANARLIDPISPVFVRNGLGIR